MKTRKINLALERSEKNSFVIGLRSYHSKDSKKRNKLKGFIEPGVLRNIGKNNKRNTLKKK